LQCALHTATQLAVELAQLGVEKGQLVNFLEVDNMEKNKKSLNTGLVTSAVMSAFLIMLSVWGNMIHEPWFDEAQAWAIAKSASWSDILFFLPHYEGHPPLWHIILKLVSYTGIPFVMAMKLIQLVFYSAAVLVFEFKSPFKPILKIVLPLGFFFLYQYSVISRPYTLFMLAVFICALYYKKRREKPFAYMLALIFMCLCHSYGIAFAGGLVIADIIADTVDEKNFFKACQKIISDKKRLVSYIILLAAAVCLVIEIMPYKDTFANVMYDNKISGFLKQLYLAWCWIPSENLITSNSFYGLWSDQSFNAVNIIINSAASLVIWCIIYFITRKRGKVLSVFVPYFCISLLMARYTATHHYGIFYILIIFALWICDECKPLSLENIELKGDKSQIARKLAAVGLCVPVLINISWSYYSFNADRQYSYDATDKLAEWIEENNYQDGYIWMADFTENNINIYNSSVTVLDSYLDKNIFCNLDRNVPYITHIVPSDDEVEADIQEMKNHGSPDFILAQSADVDNLLNILEISDEYQAVFVSFGNKVFKDVDTPISIMVYAKKGLVKNKSLTFDLE